jgi:predicted NAD/FAD-dependent oxidoreductase
VAERIADLQPAVRDIIATAIRGGAVGDPANLSAKYAFRYFPSYLAREKNNRLFALEGMQAIPRAILKRLPEHTVRHNSRVTDVALLDEQGAYQVSVTGAAGEQKLRAKHVVLAVPAPVVPDVVRNLPGWKSSALNRVASPGSTKDRPVDGECLHGGTPAPGPGPRYARPDLAALLRVAEPRAGGSPS